MERIDRSRAIESAAANVMQLIDFGFLEKGSEWIKAWYHFDLRFTRGKCPYITIPEAEVAGLVARAREDSEVFELACYVAGTRLAACKALPSELKKLMAEYLKGEFTVPNTSVGRKTNWGRDFIIINTMRRLVNEWDIDATCNLHKSGTRKSDPSASEIIVEALRATAIGTMELNRIQRIWGSRSKQTQHDEAYGLHLKSLLDDESELVRI